MRKIPHTESLLINGPAGVIEALLELPATAGTGDAEIVACAIICHPHPVHGGTLRNKVVHTLSRAFVSQQFAALRFNFRGVGKSDGSFDEGRGELEDVLAAIEWIRNRYIDIPLWLAGFSFGGAMAIHAAAESSAAGVISVAPAIYRFANDRQAIPRCPWLIVQGDKDELVDINETIEFINDLAPGPELAVFADGEHFFHGRLVELRAIVEDFLRVHNGE